MKNNYEIILKQYAAYCKEQPLYLGTAGSYGMEMLTIIREGVWAEYDILAAFHPPVGAAVQVRVGANNQISVPIEATAEKGMGEIVFAGYKEGVRQIAVDVLYKVAPSSGASGTEPAEPTPDVVQQILSAANSEVKTADGVREDMDKVLEAESGRETAEANRAAAESARVEAETARVDAEADRAAAEKERQTAESARIAAEDDRQSAETSRARVETARESAETDRVAAEAARVNAEAERTDDERLRKDHESQRVTDETARQTAESKRQEAETARADAESKRADAEQARVKAESTRVAAETTRKDAESKRDNAEQERQTAEKGRVAAEAKRTEDFAKIKESLDKIPKIDDTAITTTSPWSSKQIVDTLCPPIEETGNPVVCYPVAGYPLDMTVSWGPTQEGSGEPSPDNVRPIRGRDSVTVERCGGNLLPFGERLENIYFQQIMASDDLLLLSKAYAEKELTLTFTLETQNIVFNDNDDIWKKRIGFECNGILADGAETWCLRCWISDRNGELTKNGKKTVTVTTTMPKLVNGDITFYAQNIKSGSFVAYDFGIYAGTTAPTTYKPYNGQTNTLTLPGTVYGGEVDAVTGNGKRTWGIIDNYAGETIPREWISDRDVYSADKNPTVGAQVAYRLAEPVPFTATSAQPIPALAGANTVLTDADSVSVSSRADLIHIIRKMQEK